MTRARGLGPFTACRLCGARIDQLGREPRYFARHCDECKGAATERMKAWRRAAPIPKAVREAVIVRDGHICQHCGQPVREARDRGDLAPDTIELDHLIPVSQGGASTLENLVVACLKCNRGRSNRPLPEVAA